MLQTKRYGLLLLGGLAACLLSPHLATAQGVAPAVSVTINDLPDTINIAGAGAWMVPPGFQSHVDPNGESGGFHGEYVSGDAAWVNAAAGTVLSSQVFFTEPPPEGNGAPDYSDWLQVTFTKNVNSVSVDGTFVSDPAQLPTLGNPQIVEDGTFQDVSSLLQGAPNDFQAIVASDIPEPGSLALLVGMASGGLLLSVRRLRRR